MTFDVHNYDIMVNLYLQRVRVKYKLKGQWSRLESES